MEKTKTIFQSLIKGVFGTFTLASDKWKDVQKIPDVGKSYFDDHKKLEKPVDHKCAKNMHLIIDSALRGDMTIPPKTISIRLKDFFQSCFSVNFSFLVYYDDDTQEIKDLKRSHWLILIDKLGSYLNDITEFNCQSTDFENDRTAFLQKYNNTVEGTYTYELVQQGVKQSGQKRFSSKEESKPSAKKEKQVRCLFFLSPTLVDLNKFFIIYMDLTSIRFTDFPQKSIIRLGKEPEIEDKSRLCFRNKEGSTYHYYDILSAKEEPYYTAFYTSGDIGVYNRLKEYIPDIKLVALVPENLGEYLRENAEKRYTDRRLDKEMMDFYYNISYLQRHRKITPIIIPFVQRHIDERINPMLYYITGFLDAILYSNAYTKKYAGNFWKDFRDLSDFLRDKTNLI